MARLGRNGFLLIAVVFHLVYVYSIFDIYFVSPIVRGMREFEVPDEPAPAKRLVLFVGKFDTSNARCDANSTQEMAFERTKPFSPSRTLPPRISTTPMLRYLVH
jgi:hypothetical protein